MFPSSIHFTFREQTIIVIGLPMMYTIFAGELVLQSEQWDCCDSTLTCSRVGELHLSGIQGQHISINSGVNYTEEDNLRREMTH